MNKKVGILLLTIGGGLVTYAFLRNKQSVTISDIDSYIAYLEKNPNEENANCILLQDELQKGLKEINEIKSSSSASSQESINKINLLSVRNQKLEMFIKKYQCGTYSEISNCSNLKKKIDDLILKIKLEKDCSENSVCYFYKKQLDTYQKSYESNNCSLNKDKYSPEEISECAIIDSNIKYYNDSGNFKSASDAEMKFTRLGCRDKIEYQRQKTSASQFSREAESSETDVLGKSSTEQYVYIGIGSLVVLAGLTIIIRE